MKWFAGKEIQPLSAASLRAGVRRPARAIRGAWKRAGSRGPGCYGRAAAFRDAGLRKPVAGLPVYKPVLELGIGDPLRVIEAEIAGEHVAGGHGDQEVIGIRKAEQFKGDQKRGDRAVGDAAEEGHHADGCAQGGGQADERSQEAAEGGADEEGGNDLSALESGGNGDGGEEHFQEKGPWKSLPGQRFFDDVHAGAKIVLAAHEQGEQDEKNASADDAQIEVPEEVRHQFMGQLEHQAEQNADSCAAGGQKHHTQSGRKGKRKAGGSAENVCLYAQKEGGLPGHQGRADAGDQGCIIHDAHAGHFHGEEGRGHGRAEQGGKGRSHAAHENDFFIPFIKMEEIAERFAEAGPDLQSGAFPADGTAAENGDDGGDEDQKRHAQRNGDPTVNAFDDGIRSVTVLIMERFIKENDDKAAQGQKQELKGMRSAHICSPLQAIREGRRHQAGHQSG